MQMRDATRVVQKVIGCAAVCAAALAPAVETCWYASPDGSPEADCLTWETAGTLSNAVARMNKSGSGTEANRKWVVLKSGTVEETAVYDLAQEAGTCCTLGPNGCLGIRSESGDPRTTVLKGAGTNVALRCVHLNGWSQRIQGLTIREFAISTNTTGGAFGAAVFSNAHGSRMADCIFEDNLAPKGAAFHHDSWQGGFTISNCVFVSNRCTGGGGVVSASYNRSDNFVAVDESSFVSNRGVFAASNIGQMSRCRLEENFGGVADGSTLTDCSVISNRITSDRLASYWIAHVYSSTLRRCRLFGNFVPEITGGQGSGVLAYSSTFEDCAIVSNGVTTTASSGGFHSCTSRRNTYRNNYGGVLRHGGASTDDLLESNWCGTLFRGGSATRGVFIGNRAVIFAGDASGFLFASHCLVVSNTCSTVFGGNNGNNATLRDCTTVDNICSVGAIGTGFCNAYPPKEISNCLIVGNGAAGTPDVCTIATSGAYAQISNTVYGVRANALGTWADCQAAAREQLRFAAPDAAHPWGYCPSRLCPGVDGGLNLGYDETSTDLAGRRRVIGAASDAGCYEYEPQVGMIFLMR